MHPGDTIGNRYEIRASLGRGGVAEVFRAHDPLMQREVAVKAFLRELINPTTSAEQYVNELRMLGGLEHPHILPIYDAGAHGDIPFIVMRYADRGSLYDELSQGLPDFDRVLEVMNQIARALHYAHQREVVHRDVKPRNILIEESGDAYLGDFSLAILLPSQGSDATKLTSGTAYYMSPEQASGDPLTPRSDVYSLTATLYEMLTLRQPYEGDNWAIILTKLLSEPPTPPEAHRPDLPPAVTSVVTTGMARDPAERYSTTLDLLHALREALI